MKAKRARPSKARVDTDEAFRLLVQGMDDCAICVLDVHGRVSSWNDGARRIHGETTEEILREHVSRFYTQPDRDAGRPDRALRGAAERGRFEDRCFQVRKDGSRFWASVVVTALRGPRGALRGFAKVTRDLTEQRRSEATFAFHAALIESMGEALLISRKSDDVIVYANARCAKLLGYEPGELVGERIAHDTPPEAGPAWIDAEIERVGEVTTETQRTRKDGSAVWLRSNVTGIVDPRHGAVRLAVLTDITDRKIAEETLRRAHDELEAAVAARTAELRASEARFVGLVESELFAMTIEDAGSSVPVANQTYLDLVGYTREELDAGLLTPRAVELPEWAAATARAKAEIARSGIARHYEKELLRKDGVRVPVVVSTAALDASRAVNFILDLSAIKRNEAELVRMRASLEALHRSGVIGIIVARRDGRIRDANGAFLRLTGYDEADLAAGLSWRELTPPERPDDDAALFDELGRKGYVDPWEKEYVRKDGSRVPVLVALAAIDSTWNVAVVTDLSDQRRAHDALRRSEEQLRHAQKMEAVGRLAGGVAHDFNNMLSVILSYSEFVVEDLPAHDPMREDVLQIHQAARRAADLTHQLLLFSRHQVAAARVLDLPDVLRAMDKLLRRVLGEDIDFVVSSAPGLGRVKMDPTHFEQVVMNVTVNARDAMPRGGKLTIELSNVLLDADFAASHQPVKPGDYVMLAITDSGIGMDKATVAHIFEPFFTTKGQGKGTGLGLATVFGVVQQSGGYIWVYSEVDRGTTFKIYLPRVDATTTVSDAPEPSPTTLRGDETILLVEDEQQVRAVASGILTRSGYRVLEASNPGEALLLCERHAADIALLLTDVVMPSMSGPELAARLQRVAPTMRVLCMSGYTDDSIVRHGVLESGVAFLQKPLTPGSLTRKVRQVLDGVSSTTTPPLGLGLGLDLDL